MNPKLDSQIKNPETRSEFSPAITIKTDICLLNHVYRQSNIALLASIFCAAILLIGLTGFKYPLDLYIWFGFFIIVTIVRYCLITIYLHLPSVETGYKFWHGVLVLGAFLGGLSWGLAGGLLFPHATNTQQVLIVLLLAGITAGAIPLLASSFWAAICFLIPAILPLIVNVMTTNKQSYFLFGIALMVYCIYLIVVTLKTHAILRNAIALQFENFILLNNLSDAKEQLEFINSKLEKAATHDPLTNVANRNLFVTNLDASMAKAKLNNKLLALLYIDLDGFKKINDLHGHHVGDQLLLELVNRFGELCENCDNIARLGGDEFAIILENYSDPTEIAKVAKQICEIASSPIFINSIEIKVSASIGIGIYPLDTVEREKLINIADKAMYIVKEKGGNNYRFNVELLTE